MDVPAARHTLRIIGCLAKHNEPIAAATIARELHIPRSSTYQLIRVMQEEGFVVHYPELRVYGLGAFVAEIGSSVLRATRLASLSQPLIDRLVAASALPVVAQLAVLHGSDVSYVGTASGPRAPTTVARIGVRLPAHLTATGRALLSLSSHDQVRALFPHRESLTTRQGLGPRTLGELDEILLEARARGWALEDGEITEDYASVAASALDRHGYPAAAVGLTFRASVADSAARHTLALAAAAAAAALTARLAGR